MVEIMNKMGVISLLMGRMRDTLNTSVRIDFPNQEALYSDVHHQIHKAIEVLMPDHTVGKVRDSKEVGLYLTNYCDVYSSMYNNVEIRESLKNKNVEDQKLIVFSTTAEAVDFYTSRNFPGCVISNAIHDALHDVLTDLTCRDLCSFFKHMRFLFRQLNYHHMAKPNEIFKFTGAEWDVEQPRDDFDESLRFVIDQLQIDIGISSKVFFS